MEAMGLNFSGSVLYGQVFDQPSELDLDAARIVERKSLKLWLCLKPMPSSVAKRLMRMFA